ncbi:MAG: hypothetical protein WCC06_08040 [Candidatus Aminicenantales bacterium]
MNKKKRDMAVSDLAEGGERLQVVRYKCANAIRDMMKKNQTIEAFVHAQLAIETILWDKIVKTFKDQKETEVRAKIENSKNGKDKANTSTYKLIKWSHFLGAINYDDYSNLNNFNAKRNGLIHSHGNWWKSNAYKEALKKGIKFLEKNGFC